MIKKQLRKSVQCLNCGTEIEDFNYCPDCGQLNTNKHVSVRYFFKDFIDEFFTFDSRFFRSFVPLIRHPGLLTNEYTEGRRVRYILPLRLYLFVTFMFFFMLSVSTSDILDIKQNKQISCKRVIAEISDGSKEKISPDLQKEIVSGIEGKFVLNRRFDKSNINVKLGLGEWLDNYLKKKITRLNEQGVVGLSTFGKESVNQLPKVIFFLLPVFALILKLFYIRKNVLYIKHLIFAMHLHTVFFIFFAILFFFSEWYIVITVLLASYLYFFFALRKVYKQSRWMSFIKLNTILLCYMVLIPVGGLALLMVTIVSV